MWRQRQGFRASYYGLAVAFHAAGRHDLVSVIREVLGHPPLVDPCVPPPPQPAQSKAAILEYVLYVQHVHCLNPMALITLCEQG